MEDGKEGVTNPERDVRRESLPRALAAKAMCPRNAVPVLHETNSTNSRRQSFGLNWDCTPGCCEELNPQKTMPPRLLRSAGSLVPRGKDRARSDRGSPMSVLPARPDASTWLERPDSSLRNHITVEHHSQILRSISYSPRGMNVLIYRRFRP